MTAVNAIVAFVNPMLAKIKTFWAQNGQQIMMIVRMFMNIIKTVITSQMGYIKGIFQVAWAVISAAVKVAWGLIKIVVSTAMNFILGTIKAVLAVLRGDWQGAWDAIKGIFINTWNDIKSIFQSMDLAQIGKNLINGLISGISSMTGAVRNAVMGIVNSVKNTFTGMLKIHSPSRLFMEYGINTVQGYTMGLDKQQQPLQQATYDMANIPASYTPQSSVTTTNNRSNRSLVFNPTIQVNASQGSDTSVKKQVQEALDEAYSYLQTVYDVGVDY